MDPSLVTRRRVFRQAAQGGAALAGGGVGMGLVACAPGAAPAPKTSALEGEVTWMIADYGANAGQQWFDQTFVPAYQKDRPKAKVTMLYTAWADLG
jgi:ABC-type glycerol-3-phosphate transport system substrate-binding protein